MDLDELRFRVSSEAADLFVLLGDHPVGHLLLFAGGLLGYVLLRAIHARYRIGRARRSFPLVVGGWGTRGKSGTERLKAALFHAAGYEVFCKTTGCEAMFLHSVPYDKPAEIYLFRPYDKATIWEQMDVLLLAESLGAEVFLWECMALNPAYVSLLQEDWMSDDLVTLTNTYPDHEDIQGPAGVDIPQVMTRFLPAGQTAFTAEDQMLPILRDGAEARRTDLREVGWREAALLPRTALDRFPYFEHPANVALVLALADHLGLDESFVLRELADHVVPDIGSLKTYRPATLADRVLEFTNGMSANERRGALGNWTRLGFDGPPERGVWVVTITNNRADRIPRSQVFAGMLARDIEADHHVLVGTNTGGFVGFLEKALEDRPIRIATAEDLGTPGAAARTEEAVVDFLQASRMGPVDGSDVLDRLRAMLFGLDVEHVEDRLASTDAADRIAASLAGLDEAMADVASRIVEALGDLPRADEVARFLAVALEEASENLALRREVVALAAEGRAEEIETRVGARYRRRARQRVTVIADPRTPGSEILEEVARLAPPGFRVRVIGLQNIKGCGLDIVNRFAQHEKVSDWIDALGTRDSVHRLEIVRAMAAFEGYDALTRDPARRALDTLRSDHGQADATLDRAIESALDAVGGDDRPGGATPRTERLLSYLCAALEAILEPFDSWRRRRQAERLLGALGRRTISHARARRQLGHLVARQKGGWLLGDLRRFLANEEDR